MSKVTVVYPNTAGSHFDIRYYCDTHIPLVRRLLGPALKGLAVEHGIAGATPGSPPPIWRSASFNSILWKRFNPRLAHIRRRP
jgi:uncharacterized protein (TIGR02118 family)